MVTENYNEIQNILYITFTGRIAKSDISECIQRTLNNTALPHRLLILENSISADFYFKRVDIRELSRMCKRGSNRFEQVRHASVQNTPKNTAYALLYEKNLVVSNYYFRIFSVEKNARNWLLAKDQN